MNTRTINYLELIGNGKRLFKLVRQRTTTPDEVFGLLDELERRAELFVAVADPNHHYWVGRRGRPGSTSANSTCSGSAR